MLVLVGFFFSTSLAILPSASPARRRNLSRKHWKERFMTVVPPFLRRRRSQRCRFQHPPWKYLNIPWVFEENPWLIFMEYKVGIAFSGKSVRLWFYGKSQLRVNQTSWAKKNTVFFGIARGYIIQWIYLILVFFFFKGGAVLGNLCCQQVDDSAWFAWYDYSEITGRPRLIDDSHTHNIDILHNCIYIYIGIHPQNHLSNLVWGCLGFMTDYQDSNLPEKGPFKSPWTSAPVEEKQIINHIATWNIRLSANNHGFYGFCSLKFRIEYFNLDYPSWITRCSRSLSPGDGLESHDFRCWVHQPWFITISRYV